MSRVLILGCGYTGGRLARDLLAEGHEVAGSTRSSGRAEELRAMGVEPVELHLEEPDSVRRLTSRAPEVVFHLIPPLRSGPDGSYHHHLEGVVGALARAPLECFVYVSSTSVYGDRDGEWVDETAVPSPDSPVGGARMDAERALLRLGATHDCRPRIVRPAGIYGPGRTLRKRLEEDRYRLVEGADPWSNRIHVQDLAAALRACWQRGRTGRIYNATDDRPHRSSEYARFTAELLGLDVEIVTLAEARERYSENALARKLGSKRVANRRLRDELEVELRYPTYREGVPAALEEEGTL